MTSALATFYRAKISCDSKNRNLAKGLRIEKAGIKMASGYHLTAALFALAQHPKADISKQELVASMDALEPVKCELQGVYLELPFREFLSFYSNVALNKSNILNDIDPSLILRLANFILFGQTFAAKELFAIALTPSRERSLA